MYATNVGDLAEHLRTVEAFVCRQNGDHRPDCQCELCRIESLVGEALALSGDLDQEEAGEAATGRDLF